MAAPKRICGVCRRAPREGEGMRNIRLADGDKANVRPGLYQTCKDCFDELFDKAAARFAARTGRPAEDCGDNDVI